jgi:simple sugar transport system ATP-binding protein
MAEQILLMDKITKIYPNGFMANKQVTFGCNKGEIHALLGENGAGKTTLMKVLFGLESREEGRILLDGREMEFHDPLDALKNGIGMVHQHFMLVDELSVAENVVLGSEPVKNMLFDFNEAVKITKKLAARYNFSIEPKMSIGDCSVGIKQKIEILKALRGGARILILDEPTAVLTPQETGELFIELKKLKNAGHTIIFISHKLDEVKELCDRFTVLRNGKTVASGDVPQYTKQNLSNMMVGRDVLLNIQKERLSEEKREVVRVNKLNYTNSFGRKLLKNISFSMREGTILGVAGVEGNGQKELCEIMTGLLGFKNGDVIINDTAIKNKSVRKIRELGVSSISEDRMIYGCASKMSIMDNMIVDRYYKPKYSNGIFLNKKNMELDVHELITRFSISCPSSDSAAAMLSGGNVQKMIVAREFSSGANVVIANQPTRGIDVGSTEFIRNQLIKMAREKGVSVLLISADLNEILEISDSIMVLYGGGITAFFKDASPVTEYQLGEYMLGVKKMPDEELRSLMQ